MSRNVYSRSIPQKAAMLGLETLLLGISYVFLFAGGYQWVAGIFHATVTAGSYGPRVMIFVFNCIVYGLYWITVAYLMRREIPMGEVAGVVLAFAIYYVGYACLGFERETPLTWIDFVAAAIFLIGSSLHTVSELQRDAWKRRPENSGKLYTEGLFRYSMHINYFGDILWVSSYAIVTRNPYSIIVPVLVFCLFAFTQIPDLDRHLAQKYGEQFTEYRKRTRRLVPFIY